MVLHALPGPARGDPDLLVVVAVGPGVASSVLLGGAVAVRIVEVADEHQPAGTLAGTPVLLGCSDVDFHIPKERVIHTAQVMEQLGARVTLRLYPHMDHTINTDEIDLVRSLMAAVFTQSPSSQSL